MALYIGGVAVDATAAEIDVLDGLDRGSIIYGNASSVTTVLGQGGADEVLTSDGTDIAWAAAGGANFDTAITINDSGADADFRVEGSGAENALFVQGSDGNVGIGTAAPTEMLHLQGSGNIKSVIESTDATAYLILDSHTGYDPVVELQKASTRKWTILSDEGADQFRIRDDDNAIRLAIGQDGNVGIGVTPEAWASGFTALQIGGQASFDQPTSFSAGTEVGWNANAYYDATNDRWEAIGADKSSRVCMENGHFRFLTGGDNAYSADEAITWTNQVSFAPSGTAHFYNIQSSHLCEFQSTNASPYGCYMVFSGASPDDTSAYFWTFHDSGGAEAYIYSDGSYSQVSDRRRKKNIVDADDALVKVNQLSVKNYIRKNDESQKLHIGLIAQDVQEIYPHLITEADDDMKSLTMYKTGLIPILIKAIQELSEKNDELAAKVEALENE